MRPQAIVDVHQVGLGETGNETWARNVLRVLEGDGGAPLHYAASAVGAPQVRLLAGDERVHVVSGSSARRLAVDLPRLLLRWRPEAVLVQYTLPPSRTPGVVAVHDLSFLQAEAVEWIPRSTLRRYRLTIGSSVRRARAVLVPTEYTQHDVCRHYGVDPARVLIAPLAVDPELVGRPRAERSSSHPGKRVLCVGTTLPRKNLIVAARAVARLRAAGDDVRLRLVGPSRPAGQRSVGDMRGLLGDALEVVGPVSAAALAQEYADADVLAFPSLFEGFGLPLLEAMNAGTPVVSSTGTCLPEVAGGAALLVDPRDVDGWADALARVLRDADLANDLVSRGLTRAAGFSWERTGAAVRQALALATA